MVVDRSTKYIFTFFDVIFVSAMLIASIFALLPTPQGETPPAIKLAQLRMLLAPPMVYMLIIWFVSVVARILVFAFGSFETKDAVADVLGGPLPQGVIIATFFLLLVMTAPLNSLVTTIPFALSFTRFNAIPVLEGYSVDPNHTFNATPYINYNDAIALTATPLQPDVPMEKMLKFNDYHFLGGKNLAYIEWIFVETMKNNHSTAYLYIINFPSMSEQPWYLKWLALIGLNPDKSADVEHAFIESVPGNWTNIDGVYYTAVDNNTYAVTTFGSTVVALVVYNATLPVDEVVQFITIDVGSLINH